MPELVSVTAVQPFPYQGRSVQTGETLTVPPVEALSLTYRKLAKFSKPLARYRTAAVTPEPEVSAEPVRAKRQYRRRDLQAEE